MPLTQGIQQSLIDHIFGGGDYVRPATLHLGLSTTTISATGTNITEPSGNGYARVALTNNTTNFPVSTTVGGKAVKKNGVEIQFPEATGAWGTVTNWFLSTASSGGTIVAYGVLTNPRAIVSADIPRFAVSAFEIRLSPIS